MEERWLPSTVTTLDDAGPGSIRDAIANTPAGGIVDFQPGLKGEIITRSGILTIATSLTILGPGPKTLTLSGHSLYPVFRISAGVTATLVGLSIADGRGTTGPTMEGGAGIDNQGTLTLNKCNVRDNQDVGGQSEAFGGGIFNTGTLTVIASSISENVAGGFFEVRPGSAFGGGIYNAPTGKLTVINSTLSGNGASLTGNGSISGGTGEGGGIFNAGNLTVISSTLSGNHADGQPVAKGGGIFNTGSLTLTNTIVAGNGLGFGSNSAPDVSGAVTQADHNLIGIGDGSAGLVNGQNGNRVGTAANPIDLKLGPLQDNGGPTLTQALLPGSPALDAGDNAASPGPTDQRGLPRIFNGTIDIGAYEAQASLGKPLFALGGAPGRVQVHRVTDDAIVADFAPYGAAYTDPVNVAVGDVNGDGIDDLITAAAAGNPDVRVYDGKAFANGTFNPDNPNASRIAQWFPYGLNFSVGATVAVGDIEHNGFADIVTGADVGNPDVRVYRGKDIANHSFDPAGASLIAQWFAYALQFNVGANVAVGDVTGDGFADVVTGATAGNPDVRVYNGKAIAHGTFNPTGSSLLAQFFPYALQFNVGAFVAVGDITKSGFGDVITGASVGNPDVRVYSGKDIAQGTFDPTGASQRDQFFAYGLNFNIGVAVASADFEGTGKFDILTGASAGSPHYRVVHGNATGAEPLALFEGFAQDIQGGLAVSA